jgi:hypothetical protein
VVAQERRSDRIVADVKRQVDATWYDTVRASGASEKDADTIRGHLFIPDSSFDSESEKIADDRILCNKAATEMTPSLSLAFPPPSRR